MTDRAGRDGTGDDAALRRAIAAWSAWYVAAGVTDVVVDHPVGPAPELPSPPDPPSPPDAPSPEAAPSARPRPASTGARSAHAIAAACDSVGELETALRSFDGCPLSATATRLCFADGNPEAPVMLVGEAPGAEEDRQGLPFVGPSGQLLDRMLATIGLDRSNVYLTNLIYWRPPGNRPPSPDEIATCLPFLERQIELVRPRILVSVGGVAAKLLLGMNDKVSRLRGRRLAYRPAAGDPITTFVIFHPAYLLRNPLQKRFAWRDLISLRAELDAVQRPQ